MTDRLRWPRRWAVALDAYIGALVAAAAGLLWLSLQFADSDPVSPLGLAALFAAMLIAERMCVLVPRDAKVSVATIPHIVAVLLLPAWAAMALAGGSMLVDQLAARATARRTLFNVASIVLTVGVAALLTDPIGLDRESLGQSGQWLQVPAFLLVAAVYYGMTNGLAAVVMALDRGESVWTIFRDTTRFTLPAEFAVCGIGGLVAVIWVVSPTWAPVMLFPAVISQVALSYISSSKRSHARLYFLAEASRVLGLSLDEAEIPQRVADLVVPTVADTCIVYLSGDDGALRTAAYLEDGSNELRKQAADALAAASLQDWVSHRLGGGQSLLVRGVRNSAVSELPTELEHGFTRLRLRSLIGVPLIATGQQLGALLLLTATTHYDLNDLAMAEDLARRCAVALENARLHADAQRASRLRDEFLSVAAHELKTPLTALRGYAQLLGRLLNEDESPDPRLLAKSFRAIDTQSEKLGRLTHQLLDVSRIEAGKLQLQPCSVDLSHLVRETAMAVQAGTSNHVIQLDMSEKCVASVDPLRIEQVVTNLLSNAVKYSPNGGPIAVKLERSAQSKVTFEVRDWGVGIPMERRSQLFSRFFQAHGEGHFGGLGLGLYISRQIVDLHGGTIAVDFPLDGGTRFTVELPERVSAEQASTWPRAPRNGQTGDRTPPQGHPPVVAVHSTERVDADRQSKGVLRVAATT